MEYYGLKWIGERLDEFLTRRRQLPQELSEKELEAFKAFQNALTETEIYSGNQRLKGPDREMEKSLSRMWGHVSILVRPYDDDLANRCESKGSYWADRTAWTLDDSVKFNILLCEMRESLHDFVKERTRRHASNRTKKVKPTSETP